MSHKKKKEGSSSDERSLPTTDRKKVVQKSKEASSSSDSSSEETKQKPVQKRVPAKASREEETSSESDSSSEEEPPKKPQRKPAPKKKETSTEDSSSESSSESEDEKRQGGKQLTAPKPVGKGKAAAKSVAKPQDEEIFAEFVEGDAPQKLTAAQLKRQRKKEAEAQAKTLAEARVEAGSVEVKSEKAEEKTLSASALKKQKQKEKEQAKKEAQGKALKEKLAKEKERRDKIEQAEKAKRDAELAAIKAAKDEEERIKREAEELKEAKRLRKEAKIAAEKAAGTYMTPAQRKRHQAAALVREQLLAQGNIKVKAVMEDVVSDKVQEAVDESADSAPPLAANTDKSVDKPLKKKDKGKKAKNFAFSAEKEAEDKRIQEDAKRAQEAREAKKKADAEKDAQRRAEEAVVAAVQVEGNEIEEEDDFVGPADVPAASFDEVVSASVDDWETVGADGDEVLDDWDMDSDQEREKEVELAKKKEEKIKAEEAAKKARAAAVAAKKVEEALANAEAKAAAEAKIVAETANKTAAEKKRSKKKTSNKHGSKKKGSNKKLVKPKKEKQEKRVEEHVPDDDDDDAAFAKSRNTATGFVSDDDADEEILARFDESKRGKLRSPITCIMGHVDTGKTKILDKIRHTNVQDKEAGGITQQIGATYFPVETLQEQLAEIQATLPKKLVFQLPGLLVIDTPGHESFNNLRSRGSSLCDIAVLVVDIMHALEPQTLESIGMLRMRKTPFIIALNKIDRLYSWKAIPNAPFRVTFAQQNESVKSEFDTRLKETIAGFAKEGLNVALYFDNKDKRGTYSIVPTSAITGEGIQDMLMLLVRLSQNMMAQRLTYTRALQCTVLEVKQIDGLGTTIDVVLVNGVLREGDTIVLCGLQGPIVTAIRALLTPHPGKEMRVKGEYLHHKEVHAAMGVKICAPGMEHAVAGGQLLLQGKRDDLDELKDQVQGDLATILSQVDRSGIGVCVQASTLGSLEAILEFFRTTAKIPVSGINIGPVHKKDVMRAAVMLERKPEYAIILAFDVKVQKDAQEWADKEGVKIFTAEIIYHLFDKCMAYMEELRSAKRSEASNQVVFPCVLDILPNHIYSTRAPIILGVKVTEGLLKIGTPLCVKIKGKDLMPIGRVTSIQANHQEVQEALHGLEVAIKIEQGVGEQKLIFGRHFTVQEKLYSKLTRESLDLLKANFKEDVDRFDGWSLVFRMKPVLGVL